MNPAKAYLFIFLGCTSIFCSCDRKSKNKESVRPNIILIMADDMGFECLGTYGSLSYQTPNLDQMASNGIRVNNCISQPLCTPSRVKIMTGFRNYRNYEHFGYMNPDQYTFGNMMKDAGYKTCIAGKWQLNGIYHDLPGNQDVSRPNSFGFEEYCLWQVNKNKKDGERYADPLILQNGKELPRNPDAYGPDIFSDYVCNYIDRMSDSTFFIYYPMVLVHDPFVPTPDSEEWSYPDRRYENDTAFFKDMVAYTDKIVGKILNKLVEHGIENNTLVIFTGDNGTGRAIKSRIYDRSIQGGKGMTIDAGVHVPLIMLWPEKIKSGKVFNGTIDFSDFFATFAEMINNNKETDGISFLGLLEGKAYAERKFAFVNYDPDWGAWVNDFRNRFVQNQKYKLYQDGKMYDIAKDVNELHPMEEPLDPGLIEIRENMQKLLNGAPGWK